MDPAEENERRKKRWRYSQEQLDRTKGLKMCKEKTGRWRTTRPTNRNKNNQDGILPRKHNTPFIQYVENRRKSRKYVVPSTNMCLSGLRVLSDVPEEDISPKRNVFEEKSSPQTTVRRKRKEDTNTTEILAVEGMPVSIPQKKNNSEYYPSTFVHESRLLRVRQSKNVDLFTPDTRFEEALMAPWTRRGVLDAMDDS